MSWKGFAGGISNIKPSTFVAVYAKGTTAAKWQTLGAISTTTINIEDFESKDSLARNKATNTIKFTASCRMMQSSLVECELTDHLCDGTNDFLFKLVDAATVTTSAASSGWIKVTASQVNAKAKLICDGTPEDNRYIEVTWEGSIYKTDANEVALYTPTLETGDFGASTPTTDFYAIGTYTVATDGGLPTHSAIRTCGVSSITMDVAGGSSPDTISPVTNVKLMFEMLARPDALLRPLPTSLNIDFTFDCMATLVADLLLLGNMSQSSVKIIVTMIDGLIFTLDDRVGIKTHFISEGDMEQERVVRFSHQGKTLQSTFDSIVSS